MITIIPIAIIMKVPKIQEFLNKQAASSGATTSSDGRALIKGGTSADMAGDRHSII
jgi:Tfp pilus assembly major pilin PilA